MHCSQARNQIALLVGDDLGESDRPEVERHLSQCKACNSYQADLLATHQQLQTLSAEDSGVISGSLWPKLEPAVHLAASEHGARRFNGWVAGLAIAATVMAMFAISGDFGPVRYENNSSEMDSSLIHWNGAASNKTEPTPSEPRDEQEDDAEQRFDFRLQ